MFGRVLDEMIEPFAGSSTPETTGTRNIQRYFSETLPNIIYTNDKNIDVVKLTEVSNTRIASNQDTLRKKWLQTDNNKQILNQKEEDCKNPNGLDPFGKLSQLNATQDPTSRLRCGWIHNKTNPSLGGGALGMLEGPISSKAPGVWHWDLKLATEQMHVDICKDIQDCTDIDRPSLKQRCGWCERLQKGVPITKAGKVAYPWNKTGGCPASNTVTTGSKCPANPPPDEDEETPPEPCDPLADGRMSRACVLSKYIDAGCSDKGAIGRALATGNDHDYMNSLYSQKAFKVFQERSSLNLNVAALKTGKLSMTDAMNEFDRLSAAATSKSSGGGAIDHAVRDLCLSQGELDKFDFCTELTDASVGPYTIDCLQKAFIRAGGQKDGNKYPSTSTIAYWNTFSNWKAVLAEMQKIKATTGSSDADVKFMGTRQLINANTPDPFVCATSLIPRNIALSRGNVVARFTMTQDYKLEFDITPKTTVGGWGSIFHFSSDGSNCCTPGQRSPAIWFVPGGLGLHVRVGDTADGNWGYDSVAGCQIGKKSRIILECKGKEVKLTVDSKVHNMIQPTVRYSGPVIVYASDPWHDIPNAKLENVCFQTYGNSTTMVKCDKGLLPPIYSPSQGKLLAQNIIMTQDFKLTMDITPRGTVGNWGSIIHFTTGSDCCDLGHRAPGIWFAPNTLDTFALHVGHANDGGWAARPSGMPFQVGKTSRLELLCRGQNITVTVDSKVYKYTHDSYRYSGPLKVFGGDPWYPSANCTIMNVCLETYGNPIQPFVCASKLLPKSYVPRANTILANNITMTQDYILQFDITPKGTVGPWGSIMHFTVGGDCCGFGQRSPGIWFWPGSLKMLFVISDSQDGNWYPGGQHDGCSLNKTSRVVMVCKGKDVSVSIDNNVKKFTQLSHRYSGPATVFGSNPWYPAANCVIENVCLELLGNSTPVEPKWITRMKHGPNWKVVGGALTNVTISDTEVIFGVNSSDNIYRKDNINAPWQQLPGGLVQIAAQGGDTVVGANRNKHIFRGNGRGGWWHIPGGAHWTGASPNGDTWVVGTNGTQWGNFGFWRKDGSNAPNWGSVPGAAKMLSMGAGELWCVQDNGNIFRWNGGGWELKPRPNGIPVKSVAVSVNGKRILCIAENGANGAIFAWHGSNWIAVSGTLKQIAICDTIVIGVSSVDQIFCMDLPRD